MEKKMSEEWTIGRLLDWTTDYLKQGGAGSPRLDAEVLLADARQCKRIDLYTAYDEVADESIRNTFRSLVKRRSEGVPVAYLVGRREFYSLEFQVSSAVLIPRPETEFLVIAALDLMREAMLDSDPPRVADVGTGSGCVSVSIARHHPSCRLTATDISPAALAIAKQNASVHKVDRRIEFVESDLFTNVTGEFDLVVSNPPYIRDDEIESLVVDVRDHEPHDALAGGPSGIEITQQLIDQAAKHLRPGGWLIFEIAPDSQKELLEFIDQNPDYDAGTVTVDLAGLPRTIRAQRAKSDQK